MPRRVTPRLSVRIPLVALALLALGGCSSSGTSLLVTVNVEDFSVPFFTELDITVSNAADPSRAVTTRIVTPGNGTSEGGLPPFPLPFQLPFTVDPALVSDTANVEADGIDNNSGALLARGVTQVTVVPQHQTPVTVTLHGLSTCAGDGAASTDGGAACDGGSD
jgi:hypothetical protein